MDGDLRAQYAEKLGQLVEPDPTLHLEALLRILEQAYDDGRYDGQTEANRLVESFGRGASSELCERLASSSGMLDMRNSR